MVETVEECGSAPIIRVMRVSTAAEKVPRVSELKQQLLEQMIDQCEAEFGGTSHKEQFAQLCLSLLTYLQKMVNLDRQARSSTPSTQVIHSLSANQFEESHSIRDRKCRICSRKCKQRM